MKVCHHSQYCIDKVAEGAYKEYYATCLLCKQTGPGADSETQAVKFLQSLPYQMSDEKYDEFFPKPDCL